MKIYVQVEAIITAKAKINVFFGKKISAPSKHLQACSTKISKTLILAFSTFSFLACIQFYLYTFVLPANSDSRTRSNSICIYIDLLPVLAGNTDVYK